MSTIKVNNIVPPNAGEGVSIDGLQMPTAGALSNRNLIINGGMTVSQRYLSNAGQTASAYRACDRFRGELDSIGAYTVSQSTDAPSGFSKSFKYEVTTAQSSPTGGAQCAIQYKIEGQDLQSLAYGTGSAKSMTLSFWVKSNLIGTYSAEFFQDDNSLKNYIFSYTISAANTWEYKTVTIPGDTAGVIQDNNTSGLTLKWYQAAGPEFTSGTFSPGAWAARVKENVVSSSSPNLAATVGNTFQITGVQLEVGSKATPFEHESYAQTLAKCQRYYYKLSPPNGAFFGPALQYNATNAIVFIQFLVPMRANISALEQSGTASDYRVFYGTGTRTCTSVPTYGGDPNNESQTVNFIVSSGAAGANGDAVIARSGSNSSYLAWSAEL